MSSSQNGSGLELLQHFEELFYSQWRWQTPSRRGMIIQVLSSVIWGKSCTKLTKNMHQTHVTTHVFGYQDFWKGFRPLCWESNKYLRFILERLVRLVYLAIRMSTYSKQKKCPSAWQHVNQHVSVAHSCHLAPNRIGGSAITDTDNGTPLLDNILPKHTDKS